MEEGTMELVNTLPGRLTLVWQVKFEGQYGGKPYNAISARARSEGSDHRQSKQQWSSLCLLSFTFILGSSYPGNYSSRVLPN